MTRISHVIGELPSAASAEDTNVQPGPSAHALFSTKVHSHNVAYRRTLTFDLSRNIRIA